MTGSLALLSDVSAHGYSKQDFRLTKVPGDVLDTLRYRQQAQQSTAEHSTAHDRAGQHNTALAQLSTTKQSSATSGQGEVSCLAAGQR